jgi:hypothetical protein
MEAWKRSLERTRSKFEDLKSPTLAAAFCYSPTPVAPAEELLMAADIIFDGIGYNRLDECRLSGPEAWPFPASTDGKGFILLADDGKSDPAFNTFRQLARSAAKSLSAAPIEALQAIGVDHFADAEPNESRWVATLFAAGWWGNIPGGALLAEQVRAVQAIPPSVVGLYELAKEPIDTPSRIYWLEDVAELSVYLIDSILGAESFTPAAVEKLPVSDDEMDNLVRRYLRENASPTRRVVIRELKVATGCPISRISKKSKAWIAYQEERKRLGSDAKPAKSGSKAIRFADSAGNVSNSAQLKAARAAQVAIEGQIDAEEELQRLIDEQQAEIRSDLMRERITAASDD